ncbi:MAG: glycosyltransferase family 2 protein [Firmicutes bacterium]|nr:glycosyltransferase family 2 protein [Bacillota bacterium]
MYSVVVPMYNEEEVVRETYRRLKAVMDSLGEPYELIFVNDGSKDDTLAILKEFAAADPAVKIVDFSRNFGHQIAITAGMDYAAGEAVVVIDGDLQDPPEIIPAMIARWKEGYEVVYGKRKERKGEPFFKRATARLFYRLLNRLTEVEMPVDVGDFRLLDRKVCAALRELPEHNRYVRGIISWLGFRQTSVEFIREPRFAGRTKYPLRKMMRLAKDALASFSYKPLRLATWLGFLTSGLGVLLFLSALRRRFAAVEGGSGLLLVLAVNLLLQGTGFLLLGIVGEYLGRIYDEAKRRPLYIVRETVNLPEIKERSLGACAANTTQRLLSATVSQAKPETLVDPSPDARE